MRKRFIPRGFQYVICNIVIFLCFISSSWLLIYLFTKFDIILLQLFKNILVFSFLIVIMAVAVVAIVIAGTIIIRDWGNMAIFNEEEILITGQSLSMVFQCKEIVKYSEIVDVQMIKVTGNSQGKIVKDIMNKKSRRSRRNEFFEFKIKDGSSKLLYIEVYSASQRMEMLDIINSKTGMNFSYLQLKNSIQIKSRKTGLPIQHNKKNKQQKNILLNNCYTDEIVNGENLTNN